MALIRHRLHYLRILRGATEYWSCSNEIYLHGPCACLKNLTVPLDVILCWSFQQITVRKKLLKHQLFKYYAIERRVCPNIELRSNRLAVIKFFRERRAGYLLDRHLNPVQWIGIPHKGHSKGQFLEIAASIYSFQFGIKLLATKTLHSLCRKCFLLLLRH